MLWRIPGSGWLEAPREGEDPPPRKCPGVGRGSYHWGDERVRLYGFGRMRLSGAGRKSRKEVIWECMKEHEQGERCVCTKTKQEKNNQEKWFARQKKFPSGIKKQQTIPLKCETYKNIQTNTHTHTNRAKKQTHISREATPYSRGSVDYADKVRSLAKLNNGVAYGVSRQKAAGTKGVAELLRGGVMPCTVTNPLIVLAWRGSGEAGPRVDVLFACLKCVMCVKVWNVCHGGFCNSCVKVCFVLYSEY